MKQTFKVEGMHCSSCEVLIKDALEESDGVSSADVSSKTGEVVVDFDEKNITPAQIAEVIKKEGYRVRK